MDAYQPLYAKARQKRDEAIRVADEEYQCRLAEIDNLLGLLGEIRTPRPRYTAPHSAEPDGDSLAGMTTFKAAEHVLRESSHPLTTVELTLEIQRRGCRSDENPRKVAKNIRSAFYYHRNRFRTDDEGRWFLLG